MQSEDVLILNFADSYNGIASTVPGFSTAIVSKDSDLDYVMAYIFANAFSFAGMKKSNLKRIIIDEDIKAEFEKRVYSRLVSIDNFNTTKITSSRVKIQIHQIVSDAISEGADLILGGDDFENDNYNNVILNNVTREMRVFQKSFFGPVLQLTYTSFEPKILNKIIDQQPSRGLVLFSNDNKFVSLHQSCFRGRDHVIRPVDNERNISGIIEYNPSLETMFKMLGIKGE